MRKNNLCRGIAVLLMLMMLFSDLQIPDFTANLTYAESENEISTSQPADSSVTEPKETQADTAEPQAEIASEAVTVSGDDSTTAASIEAAATATPAPAAEETAEADGNTIAPEPTVEATENVSTPEATAEAGENDSTPETTEEPAAEVTMEPTEVCNAPSAEEATEEPTLEPTAEPTPEPVELVLSDLQASALKINLGESAAWSFACTGADSVSYTISNSNGETVASGALEESFSFFFTPNNADIYTIRVSASNAAQSAESSALLCVKDGELNFSAATAQRYAVADDTAICYELNVSGGIAPYTLSFIVKHGGESVNEQTITLGTAGAQSFSYMPTAYGEHSVEMSVRDAYGDTKTENATMPVAVRESESESTWKKSVQNVTLTGDWRKDVVAIAQSQLGYMESERDFIIREDGTRQGYTRYGAWYGAAYEEWCAMFVSFCLNYAGISENDIPQEAGCERWLKTFKSLKAYAERDEYQPQPGDIVFFNNDSHADADHVGIVESVTETQINTIEGNSGKRVQRKSYALSDVRIMGYVSMEKLMECAGVLEQFQPTPEPTAEATAEPTIEPTVEPTEEPTEVAESFDFTVEVSVSPAEAQLGETITFTAETIGNAPENLNWQWQYSTDGQIWKDIEGATEQTYTVVATMREFLHYFRAVAGLPGGEGIVMPLSLTQEAEEAAEPAPQAEEIASAPLKASMRATGDAIYWNPYASPTFDTEGDIIVAAGDDNNSGLAVDSPVCSLSRLEALVETYPAAVVYCMNLYDVYSDETTVTFAANATQIEYYESDIAGASHKGNFFSIWEDATITLQNLTINHNALELNGGTLRMGTGMHVTGHIYLLEISEDFCPILSAEANNENEGKYKIAFNPNADLDRVGIAPGDLRDLLELDADVMDGWELYIENGNTYARRVLSYTAIYLDGVNGNDANKGNETTCPVKTFARAKALMQEKPTVVGIYVMDTVTITDSQICNLFDINAEHPVVLRYSSCTNPLFKISGNAEVTFNFQLDGQEGSQNMIELSAGTLQLSDKMQISNFEGKGVNQTGGCLRVDGAKFVRRGDYGICSESGNVIFNSGSITTDNSTGVSYSSFPDDLYVGQTATLYGEATLSGRVYVKKDASLTTGAIIGGILSYGNVEMNGGSVPSINSYTQKFVMTAGTAVSVYSGGTETIVSNGNITAQLNTSCKTAISGGTIAGLYTNNSKATLDITGGKISSLQANTCEYVKLANASVGMLTISGGELTMTSGTVGTLTSYVKSTVSNGTVTYAIVAGNHLYANGGAFPEVCVYSSAVFHISSAANVTAVNLNSSSSANGSYIALSGKPNHAIQLSAPSSSVDGRIVVQPEGALSDVSAAEYISCFNLQSPASDRFVLKGESPNIVLRIQGVYISNAGSDTNDGLSKDTPVRTFAKAVEVLDAQPSSFKPYIIVLPTDGKGVDLLGNDTIAPTRSGVCVAPYSSMQYAICVPDGYTLTTSGATLDGNSCISDAYIRVEAGSVTLQSTLIENCTYSRALSLNVSTSNVEMDASSKIQYCFTAAYMAGGAFTMRGTIKECSSVAVNMADGTLNLYGSITNCDSTGVQMATGTLNLSGSISSCKALGVDMEDGVFTLSGSISGCSSSGVDMEKGTLTITSGGRISSCKSMGVDMADGSLTLAGGISDCSSAGVNMLAGIIEMSGYISGCGSNGLYMKAGTANINSGASIYGCSARGMLLKGGKATVAAGSKVYLCKNGGIQVCSGATLDLSGSVYDNGRGSYDNVMSANGAGVLVESGATASFHSPTITGNITKGNGGGIYIATETATAYTLENCNISGNTAGTLGGGVYFACPNAALNLNNVNFSNNKLSNEEKTFGGALYIADAGDVTYASCNTEGCTAVNGSALYLADNASFYHTAGVLTGNAYVYGQYVLTMDGTELPITEYIETKTMGKPLTLAGTSVGFEGQVEVHVGTTFLEQIVVKGTEAVPAKLDNFKVEGVPVAESENDIVAGESRDVYWDPDPENKAETTSDVNSGGSPYKAVETWERAIELLRAKQDKDSKIIMCSTCCNGGEYDGLITNTATGETWSALVTRGVNASSTALTGTMIYAKDDKDLIFSDVTIDGTAWEDSTIENTCLVIQNASDKDVTLKNGATIQNGYSGILADGTESTIYVYDGATIQDMKMQAMHGNHLIMTGGSIKNTIYGCYLKSVEVTGGNFETNSKRTLLGNTVYISGKNKPVYFQGNSESGAGTYEHTVVVSSGDAETRTLYVNNAVFEKDKRCIGGYFPSSFAVENCEFDDFNYSIYLYGLTWLSTSEDGAFKITNCVFEGYRGSQTYSTACAVTFAYTDTIQGTAGWMTIEDCEFKYVTYGIYFVSKGTLDRNVLIQRCSFYGNNYGIYSKLVVGCITVKDCVFDGLNYADTGVLNGIYFMYNVDLLLENTDFSNCNTAIQTCATAKVTTKGTTKITAAKRYGCMALIISAGTSFDAQDQLVIDLRHDSDLKLGSCGIKIIQCYMNDIKQTELVLKNLYIIGCGNNCSSSIGMMIWYKISAYQLRNDGISLRVEDTTITDCVYGLQIYQGTGFAYHHVFTNVKFLNNKTGIMVSVATNPGLTLDLNQCEVSGGQYGIYLKNISSGYYLYSTYKDYPITVNVNKGTQIVNCSVTGIGGYNSEQSSSKYTKNVVKLEIASGAKIKNCGRSGLFIENDKCIFWEINVCGEVSGNGNSSDSYGGIFIDKNVQAELTIDHATIQNNHANYEKISGYGGGVCLRTIKSEFPITIKNSTFIGNTAKNGGGAVYIVDGAAAKITNCSFTENSAPLGGAIYNGGTLNLAGNYMKDNVSTSDGNLSNGVYNGSTTLNIAGGLYNIQDNVYLADVSYPAQLTGVPRSGSTITFAVNNASGQYKSGSTVVQKTSYPTNAAQYLRYTRAGQPGVVLAKGNESNIVMKTAIFVDGQKGSDSNGGTNPNDALRTMEAAFEKAKENSGIIFVCGEMELSVSWSETYGVEVERYTGFAIGGVDIYPAYNGNLFRIKNGSSFTISGGSYRIAGRHLDSDTNKTAGALFVVENGATLNINAATTLEGNIRQSGNGGAIENAGTVNVNADLTIDSVKAECGGAIYNVGTLEIAEGKTLSITNASAANGGAIHNTGSVNLNGTLAMNSNTAVQNGDAVYQAGDFTIASSNAEINTDGTVYLADEKPITVKDGAEGFKITNTTLNIDIDDAFDNRVYVDYGNTTPNGTTELARYSLSDRITATFLQETKTENGHLKLYLKQRSIVYVDENYTGGVLDGYEQGLYADYPFTSLRDAYNYLKNGGGLIYLVSPVTISGNVTIGTAAYEDANGSISLNAGGVSIKRYSKPDENVHALFNHASNTDALLIVKSGAELTLKNIMLDGHSRAITSASDDYKYTIAPAVEANAPLVDVQAGGSATFKGATLSNNNNAQEGEADAVHNAETVKIADGNAVSINGTVKLENEKFITVAGSESRASRVELLLEGVYDGRVIAQYDSAPADTELGRYVLEEEVLRNYKLKIEETQIVLRQRGVYYVSDTGDDANAGTTPNAPLKTIKAAYQKMADDNDGGSIYIVGSVTLSGDVTLSQDCYLDADGKVELENGTTRILRYSQPTAHADLTGYDVASHTGYMLTVAAGASLTLENITIDGHGEAQSTGAQNTTAPGVDAQAAMLFVKGSLIVQDGAQLVNNHNVSKSSSGGAVRIASTGSMEMSAGSIAGNTAAVGAGIFHYGTALEIYGEPEIGENQIIYLGTNQKISVTGVLNAPTMKVDFAVTDYVRLHVVADYVAGVTPDLEQFVLCQQAIMKKRNLSLVRKDQQLLLEASYDVKWVLTGIEETDLPTKTGYGAEISATLKAQDTYALPESISVTVTDSEDATITLISDTDYSYDAATGAVKIFAAAVTGNVTITAEAIQCFTREADVYLYAVDDAEKLSAGQSQTAELDLLGAELNIVPALLRNKTLNVESITAGDLTVTDVASIEAVKQTAGYTTANSTFAIGAQVNGGTETGIVKDAAISFGAEVTEAKLTLTLHNANAITTADTEESAPVVTVVLTSAQKDKLTLNIHIVRVPSSINATVPLVIVMKTNIDGGAYAFQDADNYKITNNSSMRVSLTEAKADSADENVLKAAGENDDLDNMVDSYKITLRQDIANKDIAAGEGYNPIHSITFSRLSFVTRLNTETEQYGVKAASITYKLEIPKDDPANP